MFSFFFFCHLLTSTLLFMCGYRDPGGVKLRIFCSLKNKLQFLVIVRLIFSTMCTTYCVRTTSSVPLFPEVLHALYESKDTGQDLDFNMNGDEAVV